MIAVSRFWSQRVSFSKPKQKYVILGVTGPDEYENNVDNNWYTNYSCVQCLRMTLNYLEIIAGEYPDEYARVRRVTNLRQQEEAERVDTIYVGTPNHTHYDYAKQALLAGKHVICEKPFALHLEEFEELIKLA